MGFKRKPSASLLDLIEGQPGKDVPGKSQPKLPPPPPPSKPQPPQTKSSSALPSLVKLPPPPIQPADPKRKRSAKEKEPMDGRRSRTSQKEDEGRRASKQLRIAPQGQEKEVIDQPEP